jgi:hypothetical protein
MSHRWITSGHAPDFGERENPMMIRQLPENEIRRREVVFGKAFGRIVVLTKKLLDAHRVGADDPELGDADLSIDAALGAALSYDALYWADPSAFERKGDSYLLEFVVHCAAVAIEREILQVQSQRLDDAEWPPDFADLVALPRAHRCSLGFSLISPA